MPSNSRKRRNNYGFYFDYTLMFVLLFIIGFGLMMIYSTSSYTAQIDFGDSEYFFKKQLLYSVLGIAAMLFIARFFDYRYLNNKLMTIIICGAGYASMALLFSPLGITRNGATRWVRLPGIGQFQPAEVVKIGTIILAARLIVISGQNVNKFITILKICLWAGLAPALVVLIASKNMSSAIIILLIAIVMTFVVYPGYKIYVALAGAALAAALGGVTIIKNMVADGKSMGNFRLTRIMVWLNPEKYINDKGYQTVQALYAIGSGGIFGKGLGKSLQKLGYIPESQNDMIFSVICEELGLIGATCVIALFIIMLTRIVHIAQNAPDLFGSVLATGVFAHIAIQVVLNIAVVTNFIPNTGVSLPFISYGGSSAILLMAELGIVFNISSKIKLER